LANCLLTVRRDKRAALFIPAFGQHCNPQLSPSATAVAIVTTVCSLPPSPHRRLFILYFGRGYSSRWSDNTKLDLKWGVPVWTGFIWLKRGTSSGLLCTL